jgi:membrane-bound lytic murein transglycosylase B
MARLQQVAYRQLGVHPEWDAEVLAHVPADLQQVVTLNAAARRELRSMVATVSDMLPAWRIIEPLPADELLAYYREGQDATGVPWQYLAAINLVESAMGRIHGLSTAGAQGPMQFLPSTWATYGEGDINDPHAAILGAARYLAHNGGGSGNIDGALFNYNRDNRYVRAISDYAAIIAADPRAYYGYHGWDVCYFTVMGDVYLPVGYESAARIPVRDWLAQHG